MQENRYKGSLINPFKVAETLVTSVASLVDTEGSACLHTRDVLHTAIHNSTEARNNNLTMTTP